MTPQEAIAKIRMFCLHKCEFDCNCCAYGVAIKALEKQIPKKPIGDGICRYCPVCSGDVGYIDAMAEAKLKYCNKCGQAIDWSDAK